MKEGLVSFHRWIDLGSLVDRLRFRGGTSGLPVAGGCDFYYENTTSFGYIYEGT